MKPQFLILTIAALTLVACDRSTKNPPEADRIQKLEREVAALRAQGPGDAPLSQQTAPNRHKPNQSGKPKLYIDSVPSGAKVYLMGSEDDKSHEDKVLGTTPLILDPDQAPTMRFCIMIRMDDYLKQIESIPEMREWADMFRRDQQLASIGPGFGGFGAGGGGPMGIGDYFDFDTPQSRNAQQAGGGLVEIGPVYTLEWPQQNRLCAMFIPRKSKVSHFFPLMPDAGTFKNPGRGYLAALIREYKFSGEQAQEAIESLTRCGKYITRVKDPLRAKDHATDFSLTIQRAPKSTVVTQAYEVRVIPGIND